MIQTQDNSFTTTDSTTPTPKTTSTVEETLARVRKTLEESENSKEEKAKFKAELRETHKNASETLERLTNSIAEWKSAISKAEEAQKKIEDMKQDFRTAIKASLDNFSVGINPFLHNTNAGTPIKATAKSAAEKMANCKKIMVLTGAGISVASGIPTFRGEGGFWTIRNTKEKLKAIDFLTYQYFLKDPKEIWRWHINFNNMKDGKKFNSTHAQIADFQCFCLLNNISQMLVTQNIDYFHEEAFEEEIKLQPTLAKQLPVEWKDENSQQYGHHPQVYAIHGCKNYLRLHDTVEDGTFRLYPAPESINENALPLINGKLSRPHTLFFDESYNEEFYRVESVMKYSQDCDCLIVVGTALETTMAAKLVSQAVKRNAVVIEINPEPCILEDGVLQLKGKSDEFVPELFQTYKTLMMQKDSSLINSTAGLSKSKINQPEQLISKAGQGVKGGNITTNKASNISSQSNTKPQTMTQKPNQGSKGMTTTTGSTSSTIPKRTNNTTNSTTSKSNTTNQKSSQR